MQVAKEFRTWVQDIKAPEEFFYATLARIDQTSAENPGRFSVVQGMIIDQSSHEKFILYFHKARYLSFSNPMFF